ncbi:hypothetical protein GLAREA_12637 [Glarea lozoyensis ATCC 20868]|uniref:Uncharacterized protein n=1 Tax=Glarea lozoyensis (strain ATCC 20868 / MF5171) TaxID=1116229 RepID=S3D2H2_GLAL2|nr:uncharacterized protein GLAREA_12637 [Glarea lozoyensis ATCC 20868]EPE31334.1 hypothetical protein GLAREA_12637 [Glarea lozoyensis ATCC 20868]
MSTSTGGLTASPLTNNFEFNWVFLVELLVCGILTLFFLFYFNRLFATLISYGFRAWTWHKYRVYVDIQALQISLLGGRIFFKGFKYHGNNETILIHSGFFTWCYWLRNVRGLSVGGDSDVHTKRVSTDSDNNGKSGLSATLDGAEQGGPEDPARLPCRFTVNLNGVEWIVYNRSVAYDAVIAGMMKQADPTFEPRFEKEKEESADPTLRHRKQTKVADPEKRADFQKPSSSKETSDDSDLGHGTLKTQQSSSSSQTETSQGGSQDEKKPEGSFILRLLPIHVTCNKAAVVLGNENTKSVLIAKADGASGEIDAARSNTIDQYRQLINFNFKHPVIQIKPNDDYKEDQTTLAIRVKRGEKLQADGKPTQTHNHSFVHRQRRKVWHTLQNLVPAFRSSVDSVSSSTRLQATQAKPEPGSGGWQGLSRYLDENEQDDNAKWSSIEYATVTTIADSPAAYMSFYWDVPGTVPERQHANEQKYKNEIDNINGDAPPEWGLNLSLNGAIVNYGPWADRQRADIQRVFFPSLCKDAVPSRKLSAGQFRVPTEFKVYIEFDEETILRVPIKEESKNWKWTKHVDSVGAKQTEQKKRGSRHRKRKADSSAGPEIRPFGWLDVKVGSNATVTYTMDMLAGPFGFSNNLELELPNIEITTSVNHGTLWRSVDNRISCDLSNPLQWNGQHIWKFDVTTTGLELFILREHVFLLQDLIEDWASGPPPEYLTFSPFQYSVNLHLDDFRIYLNVNDSNIINNPSDFDDNTFIIIFGSVLAAKIGIPLDTFRPYRNDISFDVDASNGGLNLHIPPWNTQATFLSSSELATLKDLKIAGKYQYCATTSPNNTDTLLLDVYGDSPTAQFYGFVIRYYLKIKDNYFGDDIRFKTLEEYQEVLGSRRSGGDNGHDVQPHKKSNDLDVILSVKADRSSVILPCNLYTAKNHIRIEIASLAADMRFTNYYMDLEVMLSTLAFSSGSEESGNATPISATSSTQLFVDGVNVVGNRLFGLPPTEPTYICNWDFAVGAVTGECSADFFSHLINGVKAFAFSFDDDENAQPSISIAQIHDVTFLRATVESVQIWLHVEETAFLLSTAEISVNFNDWAGTHYSKKLNLLVPQLHIGCVDAESASRHRSRAQNAVETHAFVQTTLSVAMIERNPGFEQDRLLQQEHIKRHDQRTHRTQFLLQPNLMDNSMLTAVDPPALSIPPMPAPVAQEEVEDMISHSSPSEMSSLRRSVSSVKRKSSFLSLSSAGHGSDHSVLRPESVRRSGRVAPDAGRSRNLSNMFTSEHQAPTRDVSTSSGRRSSFYSAVGEHRGIPPPTVTFSSSYMAPYFPLQGIEPDRKDLPTPNEDLEQDFAREYSRFSLDDVQSDRVDDNATHVSFIIELSSGLQGVFSPTAIEAINNLLAALQPVDPNDLLDSLQMDSINEIFDLKKQKDMTGTVLDLTVRAPEINFRLLNSSTSAATANSQDMRDQYDLSVSRISLTSRSVTALKIDGQEKTQNSSTLQLSIKSAGISAKERLGDMDDPQAAVTGIIRDLNCWYVSNKATAASVAFKTVEIATVSSKIEYLASLLHRTGTLASSTAESFSSLNDQQRIRMQFFTYFVATEGQQATDPMFLTRPSYVLRTAPDHLRSSDSWKVVTRLHHMYNSLDVNTKQDLKLRCISVSEPLPDDAERRVLAGFDHWRSWDLHDVDACLVMKRVYGTKGNDTPQPAQASQPLKFTLRTESVRLVLDPGPKQNEVSLLDITAVFEDKTVAMEAETQSPFHGDDAHYLVLQVFCASTALNLNWELCELADDIMSLYLQSSSVSARKESMKPRSGRSTSKARRDLHVTIATEVTSIILDTVNIRATSLCNGLKASFVMIDDANSETTQTMNMVLAADAATSKIKSRSQDLTVHQIRLPSIYASFEKQAGSKTPIHTIKVAANCRQLSFVILQDILALMEVLDLVIGDELAQLHRLKNRIPSHSTTPTPDDGNGNGNEVSDEITPVTKVNIALFLDEYQISVLLLRSLTYNVSGLVARASIAAQVGSDIIFDFDIKEHSHDMQTTVGAGKKSISLLQMPPTNGRIGYHISDSENTVSVFVSVEPIQLDAAAIHSLLSALNRPEISSVITDVQEEFKAVQGHLEEIFGPQSKSAQHTALPANPLIYDAHLTLAGFNIFANAHEAKGGSRKARLDFNLGCVQLLVANRLEQNGPALAFPELRVALRHISFELSRSSRNGMQPCGNLVLAAFLTATSKTNDIGEEVRSFHLKSDALNINLFAETASTVVDVIGYLQTKIKDIDFSREKHYLRKLRKLKPKIKVEGEYEEQEEETDASSINIFESMFSLELLNLQVCWLVGTYEIDRTSRQEREDLVFSLKRIDFSTKKKNTARLTMEDLQVQMVPASHDKRQRSLNSALLPEIIFNVGYVSTSDARRFAFQAAGKSLDLRLTSQFMIPGAAIKKSIGFAVDRVRDASASWTTAAPGSTTENSRRQPFFGKKRMESLLVDADFAGAVVHLSGKKVSDSSKTILGVKTGRIPQTGRYGQFTQTDASNSTILRAPGLAWKVEYKDDGLNEPSLNAEIKVDASSNTLYPAVVPLIMEISSTVKDIVSDEDKDSTTGPLKGSPQKFMSTDEDNILTADPSAVLGRTRLNLGFRICRQEFTLSCQPIARVSATARFDDIYITINTVKSTEHGHFFAASAIFTRLQASVQHVYSRESTGSFDVDSVFLSLMNSKHVSGISGVSTILKISPMKILINAKQIQDFLLFREIWIPQEIRQQSSSPAPAPSLAPTSTTMQSQTYLVQRYQQVAATGAFPWNATVSIAELDVQLDFGQAIGRSAFIISNFWVSSKKNSDWEQNLCLGFDKVGVNSTGRMSGFVTLQDFHVRTSIQWPAREMALNQTPLVQASLRFGKFRVKAAFEYQAFLVADITSLEFLMYNVRNGPEAKGDRLVAILDGETVQVFCTTTTASQALALYQAFVRLAQEKRANYEASLTEIDKFMKRKSISHPVLPPQDIVNSENEEKVANSPISLHTDVIVTLKAVNMGAFPNTFSDHQVFKLEALNAQARFAVTMDEGKIHSILGLTLGQLRIGLAGVKKIDMPKSVGDLSVEDVVNSATGSRGGTILKVPKVEATMQTWQVPNTHHIDYIFKSSFEGKVEVGWNYSRISYIRSMWASHAKALAQRLGKPLPPSAVKITGVPDEEDGPRKDGEQQKITAEVNVPQSRYDYTALQAPIIETPQLRDMGEATPPLEWIGLHRDRLPNLTHQIVIVTLLELASEVEDAYAKILGSS